MSTTAPAVILAAGLLWLANPVPAATLTVSPGQEALASVIARAEVGDTVVLAPGRYQGPVSIERSLNLVGTPGSQVDGGGYGRVITIAAPDVSIRGLLVTNSGSSLASEDGGIYVTADGDRALIEGNHLKDNLIGVNLKGPQDALVRGNTIEGRRDLRMNERGNGIALWNAPGSVIEANTVRFGRDGIFVTTSRNNAFRGNTFRDLRFAIHYMYTNTSEVSGNASHGNHIGYALMFSDGLQVHGNLSQGDRDRGILLNYANRSQFHGNIVRDGPEKCVFIYNANMNSFRDNRFEGCDIGIHFTAGSERNVITGNAFIGSRTQVKYVGSTHMEWSENGRGNYWSDNSGFDLNGDGIADRPYRPNDLVDQVVWRHPLARLLLNSAVLQVLRWAQSEFPALHPGGIVDSAPLMSPPAGTSQAEG